MRLLVTTALEETWGRDEPILFLGEWCRLYGRKAAWSSRPHEVVRNHWDDREKLRRDHDYLKALHDRLLTELSDRLNRLHRLERSRRYWQILLDPWLVDYVAVVWDRWECLRLAFEERGPLKTIVLEAAGGGEPFSESVALCEGVHEDSWNHRLFREIIESNYADRCVVETRRAAAPVAPASAAPGRSIKARVRDLRDGAVELLDAALGLLPVRDGALFYSSYFPPRALLRLNLRLGQTPRWYWREFRWPVALGGGDEKERRSLREGLSLELTPQSPFEALLFKRVVRDLPSTHVESFAALRARAERIPMRPRAVFAATAHWWHDLFKLWCAERVHAGARFIAMTHGGGVPLATAVMSFEEEISDVKTTWSVPYHRKHVRLPPNKLVARRFRSTREHLAVAGHEMPLYAHRAQSAPQGGQTLVGCEMVCELYSRLSAEVQAAFVVKPYPERGWNMRQRYVDALGAERVSNERNYGRFLARARMIVCTNPETAFSEGMASGLPTLLFYPARLWETIPQMTPLLEALRAAKIAFDSPAAAAAHIDAVWNAPERWWDDAGTRAAREEFRRLALDSSEDWLEPWAAFVEVQLDESADRFSSR